MYYPRSSRSPRICNVAWAVAIGLLPLALHPIARESSSGLETEAPAGWIGEGAFSLAPAPTAALPAVPGVTADWWTRAQADIARREYEPSVSGERLQAPNRAQGFRSIYDRERIAVEPREVPNANGWSFTWRTARWGRPNAMQHLAPPSRSPIARGPQVTYARPGFREWYENRREGLEQGFTIAERPVGRGPVVIEGEIGGGLRAHLRPDGDAVDLLDERGECVLRYSHLLVSDAGGQDVPARLAATDHCITILIEDEDARYPLTVDPILTTPSWTGESNQASAQYGISVSTAGDVNGDGFSDVIVGAIGYDNGQTDEGRAFLYLGSPTGLGVNPLWFVESNQAGGRFGLGASTAGDVNGDGFADLIIGAYNYDNGQTDEGRAYVYYGSEVGPGSAPAWTAESNQAGAAFGRTVGTAGDVNRDGYADVIVTANLFDNGQPDEGRAYVYHGSATGLGAAPAWIKEGDQTASGFGSAAGTAGDVNADGFADVVVGAYLHDDAIANEGQVSLYFGSSGGLATTAASTVESGQALSHFGFSTGTAGDVNGDGYADVIVGAPRYTNVQSTEGRVFIYRGHVSGLVSTPWTSEPNEANAQWGFAVGTAGDVNGDSYADIIVGAPFSSNGEIGEGLVAIQQGSPAGPSPLWGTWSEQPNARLGIAVATAGDVNGDGLSDVIVGADFYDNGQTDEGRAFLYHGSTTGPGSTPGWTAESNQAGSLFGGVASAGDLNGDGYSDVVVGAPGYDHGEDNEGQALVYFGSRNGLSPLPGWTAESNETFAFFGASVATAGDVNGDGFSDLIVGAIRYPFGIRGIPGNGKVYVYHGSAAGLGLVPDWTAEADSEETEFGVPSCTAGDVNGDGYSDVIIGALRYDNGELNEGRAFVYEGSAAGLQAEPAWVGESNQDGALFGGAVSGAGDVNGDGYSDILVSAVLYDNGQTDEGRVFLYPGSSSGPRRTPAWTFESNQEGFQLGGDQGSAGDVNGDGFSDVLVSAFLYTNGQLLEGRAYLFEGSATGLSAAPDWTVESNQEAALFGMSVSTAGDVDGDGFSEVLIGAPGYNSAQTPFEGGAFLYFGSATGLAPNYTWSVSSGQEDARLGSSVALAGDVNGDGFSDILLAAPYFDQGETDEGQALLYYGNGGDGLQRIPRQAQADGAAPIDLLGRSSSLSSFRVNALGRTAAGRGLVWLEVEVEPAGTPFDGEDLLVGPATVTDSPAGPPVQSESIVPLSVLAGGLTPGGLYHWRVRTRSDSPFFPNSPWLSMPLNSITEADVRTAATIGIADLETAPGAGVMLAPSAPNPFHASTRVAYRLPAAGEHRVAIYDVQGRVVRVLATGHRPGGHQAVNWDGRDARGAVTPAGVYFVRLDFAGRTETGKVVLVPGGR